MCGAGELLMRLRAIACCLFATFVLSGCGFFEGPAAAPSAGYVANHLCERHRGVRAMEWEPYDPEYGGGGLAEVICRDGLVREP